MSVQDLLSQIADENDRRLLARLIDRYLVLRARVTDSVPNQLTRERDLADKERELSDGIARYERAYQANLEWWEQHRQEIEQLQKTVDLLTRRAYELGRENDALLARNAELERASKAILEKIRPSNVVLYQSDGVDDEDS